MHTYYSCLNNSYQYSKYTIFVAEVASTVNELLLDKYGKKMHKSKGNAIEPFSLMERYGVEDINELVGAVDQ